MSITRRKFLKAGTVVALASAIPLRAKGQQIRKSNDGNPIDQNKDPLAGYTRATFSSYLNSVFRLYTGYSFVDVTLVEVEDLAPGAAAAQTGGECFTLLFRGGSVALPQNTYQIEHASLGRFPLFLVPGAADGNGLQSFVATINRLPYSQATFPAPTRLAKPPVTVPPQRSVTPPMTTRPAPATNQPKNANPSKRRGADQDSEGVIS